MLNRDDPGVLLGALLYGLDLAVVGALNVFRVNTERRLEEKLGECVDLEMMDYGTALRQLDSQAGEEMSQSLEVLAESRSKVGEALAGQVGLVQAVVTLVSILIVLGSTSPWLVLMPIAAAPSVWLARRSSKVLGASEAEAAPLLQEAREIFELGTSPAAGREVRVYGLAHELTSRYQRSWAGYESLSRRTSRKTTAAEAIGLLVFFIGFTSALLVVLESAGSHPTAGTFGSVVLVLTLATQVNQLVGRAAASAGSLGQSMSVFRRLGSLAGLVHDSSDVTNGTLPVGADPARPPARLRDGVRLVNVTYQYARSDHPAIEGLTCHIPAGSVVAVVGENGSGKTTLVRLMLGLIRPSSGEIRVDGTRITDMFADDWWHLVSAVMQDFVRFELVARESTGIGRLQDISEDELIERAASRAGVSKLLKVMPTGLDTILGNSFRRGLELSGGQWQQIALIRAQMREDSLIQVLDEPSASLDPLAERRIYLAQVGAAASRASSKGGVTVLISHRLSVTREADVVMVMEGGRLVEMGSHMDLVRRGGCYARMFEKQARWYREEGL